MKTNLKKPMLAIALLLILPVVALAADGNTFFGEGAGTNTTTGGFNTFIGLNAGNANRTSIDNVFIGANAGFNAIGTRNTFVGKDAGKNSETSDNNTFIGWSAGQKNTAGTTNTFIGSNAGRENTTGSGNVFVGLASGINSSTGDSNTFLGRSAGVNNTSGSGNVFIGFEAGANETGSNKLYVANSNTDNPLIYGDFSANQVTINGALNLETLCLAGDCKSQWPTGGSEQPPEPSTPMETTVDKNEINNIGALGFQWNDAEINDDLSIGSTGKVDVGALPISTTGIIDGNMTQLATVNDIYDFVMGNVMSSFWKGDDTKIGFEGDVFVGDDLTVKDTLKIDGVIKLNPKSQAPTPCNKTTAGSIYYNSRSREFYGCNGSAWRSLDF